MPFTIIRNDITKVTADAIVNTANPRPVVGGGTDSGIYQAAGKELLLTERRKIGEIARGDAVHTPAFGLNAKYIIHTVGPVWIDGKHGEREILHSCYAKSLALAAELSCESIAFPLISTGSYEFPRNEALDIALSEISRFLLMYEKDMDVILVVFDKRSLQLSKALVGDIDEFIDDHSVKELRAKEYGYPRPNAMRRRREEERRYIDEERLCRPSESGNGPVLSDANYDMAPVFEKELTLSAPMATGLAADDYGGLDVEGFFTQKEDTFQQRLLKLIDERHLEDPDVYKKANVSRKVFSKIRCNRDYHPSKKTAMAFAIALELNLPEMRDLLSRAGWALSPGSLFDYIIIYFVRHGIYDIFEINAALFKYDQELLGY